VSTTDSAHILSGPTPDSYGNAIFVIGIGPRQVKGFATPTGEGVLEADLDVAGLVMRAIGEFRKLEPEKTLACLREAAHLRREAGHASPIGPTVPNSVQVLPKPVVREKCVVFTVEVDKTQLGVLVFRDGAVVDNYDPDHLHSGIHQSEVIAAQRAVLNLILSDRQQANTWGLDPELLDLLWN
jgi:hypothetical protein